jgi:prophage antirepressor-like protein
MEVYPLGFPLKSIDNIEMTIYQDLDNSIVRYNNKTISVIIDNNDQIWFSAKETSLALGYKNTKGALRNAISKNVPKRHRRQLQDINAENKQGHPHTLYINEPGLYRLMLRCRLKAAEKFFEWVTENVIPSIRTYGRYKLVEEHKKEVREIFDKINYLEHENKKLKQDQRKPKFPNGGVVYVIDYSDQRKEIYRIGMTGSMKTRKQLYDTHTLHNHQIVHIVETIYPIQLESCILSLLNKYRYFTYKKDFFECKLSTIKSAFTKCIKDITSMNKKYKQRGGSKTSKKPYRNLIEKEIIKLRKEAERIKKRIKRIKK